MYTGIYLSILRQRPGSPTRSAAYRCTCGIEGGVRIGINNSPTFTCTCNTVLSRARLPVVPLVPPTDGLAHPSAYVLSIHSVFLRAARLSVCLLVIRALTHTTARPSRAMADLTWFRFGSRPRTPIPPPSPTPVEQPSTGEADEPSRRPAVPRIPSRLSLHSRISPTKLLTPAATTDLLVKEQDKIW